MQAFWKFDIHLVWWVASLRFMALILSWALGCEMTASQVGSVRGTSSLTSVTRRSADWAASSHVSWERLDAGDHIEVGPASPPVVSQRVFYLPFLHLDDETIGQPTGIKGEESNSECVL